MIWYDTVQYGAIMTQYDIIQYNINNQTWYNTICDALWNHTMLYDTIQCNNDTILYIAILYDTMQ